MRTKLFGITLLAGLFGGCGNDPSPPQPGLQAPPGVDLSPTPPNPAPSEEFVLVGPVNPITCEFTKTAVWKGVSPANGKLLGGGAEGFRYEIAGKKYLAKLDCSLKAQEDFKAAGNKPPVKEITLVEQAAADPATPPTAEKKAAKKAALPLDPEEEQCKAACLSIDDGQAKADCRAKCRLDRRAADREDAIEAEADQAEAKAKALREKLAKKGALPPVK